MPNDDTTPAPTGDSVMIDAPAPQALEDAGLIAPRHAVITNPHALSEAEESDGEDPLRERIEPDEGLLDDYDPTTTELDLIHLRIHSIPALNLTRFPQLTRLCLRENQIDDLPPLDLPLLTELDLYDNRLSHAPSASLAGLRLLENLDLSFNNLRHVPKDLGRNHPKLKNLYFVQNKITRIAGLAGLKELKNLELGANRIRTIEGLEELEALEELWLGKNKITTLSGLPTAMSNLRILSIQSNRITEIKAEDLEHCPNLEELYLSHNGLTSLEGSFDKTPNLKTLDLSSNKIASLRGLKQLRKLEELWASNNLLSDFREIEEELGGRKEEEGETVVETVYFEGNPLQRDSGATYRGKVRLCLPGIRQIDATFVR